MKAVILAAGEGKRMRPYTEKIPKPLLPYGGHTLLEELLSRLAATELFESFVIVSGYLGEQIIERVGLFYRNKLPVVHVHQPKPTGTYDALRRARRYLGKNKFLVIHPDDIHDPEAIRKAAEHEHAIVAAEAEDPSQFGVIEVADGYLRRIVEKPPKPISRLVSTAAVVTDVRILDSAFAPMPQSGRELMIPDAIMRMTEQGIRFKVVTTKWWVPISTPTDLAQAHKRAPHAP